MLSLVSHMQCCCAFRRICGLATFARIVTDAGRGKHNRSMLGRFHHSLADDAGELVGSGGPPPEALPRGQREPQLHLCCRRA